MKLICIFQHENFEQNYAKRFNVSGIVNSVCLTVLVSIFRHIKNNYIYLLLILSLCICVCFITEHFLKFRNEIVELGGMDFLGIKVNMSDLLK